MKLRGTKKIESSNSNLLQKQSDNKDKGSTVAEPSSKRICKHQDTIINQTKLFSPDQSIKFCKEQLQEN